MASADFLRRTASPAVGGCLWFEMQNGGIGTVEARRSRLSKQAGRAAARSCGMIAVGLPALLLVVGCASASKPDVQETAERFQTAVRQHQDATACSLLSDEARSSLESASARSCTQALGALRLSTENPTAIEVWGDNAQARLPDGALFLAEFSSGWRIIGAGCTPRPDRPYSCAVRG